MNRNIQTPELIELELNAPFIDEAVLNDARARAIAGLMVEREAEMVGLRAQRVEADKWARRARQTERRIDRINLQLIALGHQREHE